MGFSDPPGPPQILGDIESAYTQVQKQNKNTGYLSAERHICIKLIQILTVANLWQWLPGWHDQPDLPDLRGKSSPRGCLVQKQYQTAGEYDDDDHDGHDHDDADPDVGNNMMNSDYCEYDA